MTHSLVAQLMLVALLATTALAGVSVINQYTYPGMDVLTVLPDVAPNIFSMAPCGNGFCFVTTLPPHYYQDLWYFNPATPDVAPVSLSLLAKPTDTFITSSFAVTAVPGTNKVIYSTRRYDLPDVTYTEELYVSDGTLAGTRLLQDFNEPNKSSIVNVQLAGDRFFIAALDVDGNTNFHLLSTDANSTSLVAPLVNGLQGVTSCGSSVIFHTSNSTWYKVSTSGLTTHTNAGQAGPVIEKVFCAAGRYLVYKTSTETEEWIWDTTSESFYKVDREVFNAGGVYQYTATSLFAGIQSTPEYYEVNLADGNTTALPNPIEVTKDITRYGAQISPMWYFANSTGLYAFDLSTSGRPIVKVEENGDAVHHFDNANDIFYTATNALVTKTNGTYYILRGTTFSFLASRDFCANEGLGIGLTATLAVDQDLYFVISQPQYGNHFVKMNAAGQVSLVYDPYPGPDIHYAGHLGVFGGDVMVVLSNTQTGPQLYRLKTNGPLIGTAEKLTDFNWCLKDTVTFIWGSEVPGTDKFAFITKRDGEGRLHYVTSTGAYQAVAFGAVADGSITSVLPMTTGSIPLTPLCDHYMALHCELFISSVSKPTTCITDFNTIYPIDEAASLPIVFGEVHTHLCLDSGEFLFVEGYQAGTDFFTLRLLNTSSFPESADILPATAIAGINFDAITLASRPFVSHDGSIVLSVSLDVGAPQPQKLNVKLDFANLNFTALTGSSSNYLYGWKYATHQYARSSFAYKLRNSWNSTMDLLLLNNGDFSIITGEFIEGLSLSSAISVTPSWFEPEGPYLLSGFGGAPETGFTADLENTEVFTDFYAAFRGELSTASFIVDPNRRVGKLLSRTLPLEQRTISYDAPLFAEWPNAQNLLVVSHFGVGLALPVCFENSTCTSSNSASVCNGYCGSEGFCRASAICPKTHTCSPNGECVPPPIAPPVNPPGSVTIPDSPNAPGSPGSPGSPSSPGSPLANPNANSASVFGISAFLAAGLFLLALF